MNNDLQIVDRGRGLQLSNSRVRVQDLVPYFQEGCSYEEIMRWIPCLTAAEIAFVEQYYQEHKEELDEEDQQIRARNAARIDDPRAKDLREKGRAKLRALRDQLNLKGRHDNAKDNGEGD